MLPIAEDARTRSPPLAVAALLAVNAALFAYAVGWGDARDAPAFAELLETWGLVPRELLRGVAHPGATPAHTWLTPLTAMFLHAGPLHLAGNLLLLWVFGSAVEDLLGPARFLLFYLACGLAAAAAQVAADPGGYAPVVGASGAVAGVLGACAVALPAVRLRLAWPALRLPAPLAGLVLAAWVALQLASGLAGGAPDPIGPIGPDGPEAREAVSGVAGWAHLGGFAAGLVLGHALRSAWVRKPTHTGPRS